MIRSVSSAIAFALAFAASAAAAPAERVSFIRTIPAEYALPGERVAVIYALGDTDVVHAFVDAFVERANRERSIPIIDATDRNHLLGDHPDIAIVRRVRRESPADTYLGVNRFRCESSEHAGDIGGYDVDRTRVKRRQVWVDTLCRARVDVFDGVTLGRLFSFEVKGEGTSARVTQLTDEDRKIAAEQAARFAALSASELVTPRQVRESIELDETAPGFDKSRDLIESDRLIALRSRWEKSLRQNAASAPLHFDLAAVCEALGDAECARTHYEQAEKLSPANPRYRSELSMFRRRYETKK